VPERPDTGEAAQAARPRQEASHEPDNPCSSPPLTEDSHAVAVIDPSTNQVDEALSVVEQPRAGRIPEKAV
jgi:hypothetical protein